MTKDELKREQLADKTLEAAEAVAAGRNDNIIMAEEGFSTRGTANFADGRET